ncbi:MAG: hypothetical protein R2708_23290 [Vicinamibacterales bacterium]
MSRRRFLARTPRPAVRRCPMTAIDPDTPRLEAPLAEIEHQLMAA